MDIEQSGGFVVFLFLLCVLCEKGAKLTRFYFFLIAGFQNRKHVELSLEHCAVGTFIIRFSLSKSSYLAISWVNSLNGDGGEDSLPPSIHHCLVECRSSGFVVAFPTGAVQYLSLEKLCHNLKKLQYLYPRLHKDQAFDVRR